MNYFLVNWIFFLAGFSVILVTTGGRCRLFLSLPLSVSKILKFAERGTKEYKATGIVRSALYSWHPDPENYQLQNLMGWKRKTHEISHEEYIHETIPSSPTRSLFLPSGSFSRRTYPRLEPLVLLVLKVQTHTQNVFKSWQKYCFQPGPPGQTFDSHNYLSLSMGAMSLAPGPNLRVCSTRDESVRWLVDEVLQEGEKNKWKFTQNSVFPVFLRNCA